MNYRGLSARHLSKSRPYVRRNKTHGRFPNCSSMETSQAARLGGRVLTLFLGPMPPRPQLYWSYTRVSSLQSRMDSTIAASSAAVFSRPLGKAWPLFLAGNISNQPTNMANASRPGVARCGLLGTPFGRRKGPCPPHLLSHQDMWMWSRGTREGLTQSCESLF